MTEDTECDKLKCTKCNGKGYTEYFKLDGQTIYSWMTPSREPCAICKPNGELNEC